MFASLLFLLPVSDEGGAFQLFDDSWKDIVDQKQAGSSTWVAFCSDVRHCVKKVESGFRMVLNYKLLFEGVMSPSPALRTFEGSLETAFSVLHARPKTREWQVWPSDSSAVQLYGVDLVP